MQDVALARGEIHIDRIELNDRGENGGGIRPDQLADRDLPRRHDAVEGRGYVGVAEVDLGLLLVGLRRLQVGLRRVAQRQRFVVSGHGRDLPLHEVGLACVLGLVLLERRLGAGDRGLGSLDLEPVGLRLDGEQRSALLDVVAVGVADRLGEARTRATRSTVLMAAMLPVDLKYPDTFCSTGGATGTFCGGGAA